MDLSEILKSADSAFEQVKKVSSVTQDAGAIFGQLSSWAGQAGELRKALLQNDLQDLHQKSTSSKKPKKSATEQAMEIYAAKVKLQEMESAIYQMFIYGDLCHLGKDGYNEFLRIRSAIEAQVRDSATQEQAWELAQEADGNFIKQLQMIGGAMFASIVAVVELAEKIKGLMEF